jgi:hypothetical protein
MVLQALEKPVVQRLELTLLDGTLGEFSWDPCEQFIYFAKRFDDPFPTLEDPMPTELHIFKLGVARRTYSLTSTRVPSIDFQVAGRVGSKQSVIRYCDAPVFKHLGLGHMRIYYIRREMEKKGTKIEKFVFDGIWIPGALWDLMINTTVGPGGQEEEEEEKVIIRT